MNENEKTAFAEKLLDSIGLIDDRFIAEAQRPVRARSAAPKRFAILAVAATLTLCTVGSVLLIGRLATIDRDSHAGDVADTETEIKHEADAEALTLGARLDGVKESTVSYKVDREKIDLFDGSARIVWKYSDETEYRACELSSDEANKLISSLKSSKGQRVDKTDTEDDVSLWIYYGDGRVISPYLELTEGNVGYGEIFDYTPEYEPSQEFSDIICGIIS